MTELPDRHRESARYWDALAPAYQQQTRIDSTDFHLGPLLPSATALDLMPPVQPNWRCLEAGCGAAQNSIYLARQGATCCAVDVSGRQLARGRELATEAGVELALQRASLTDLPPELTGFDFIHSVYALPFVEDPGAAVAHLAGRLRPGGWLLLSVGHPLFAGEWLELGDEGEGMYLPDYFRPPADVRVADDAQESCAVARYYPLAHWFTWLRRAGLQVTALAEPEPAPLPQLTPTERHARVPYDSEAWDDLYPVVAKVPVVAVFVAQRPEVP